MKELHRGRLILLAIVVVSYLGPKVLNWVHIWAASWPGKPVDALILEENSHCTCTMRRNIVILEEEILPKSTSSKWNQSCLQNLSVLMLIEVSNQNNKVTFPISMKNTPDGHPTATRMHPRHGGRPAIKLFSPSTNSCPSITTINFKPGLITKDGMKPVLYLNVLMKPGPFDAK